MSPAHASSRAVSSKDTLAAAAAQRSQVMITTQSRGFVTTKIEMSDINEVLNTDTHAEGLLSRHAILPKQFIIHK